MTLRDRSSSTHPPRPATRRGVWDDWRRVASPEQVRAALDTACRQGLLYEQQLPPAANGSHADLASRLREMLAGRRPESVACGGAGETCFDEALDEAQREAVRRATATPDVAVMQGYPGSGKSRIVAEILRRAAAAGHRVLLIAAGDAGLDKALSYLPADVACVRLGGDGPRSLSEAVRHFDEVILPAARADAGDETELAIRNVFGLVQRRLALGESRRESDGAIAALPGTLARDCQEGIADWLAPWREARDANAAALAGLDAEEKPVAEELATVRADLAPIRAEFTALEAKQSAKQSAKFWSGAFWSQDARPQMTQLAQKMEPLAAKEAELAAKAEEFAARRSAITASAEALRDRLRDEEQRRREAYYRDRVARDEVDAAGLPAAIAALPEEYRDPAFADGTVEEFGLAAQRVTLAHAQRREQAGRRLTHLEAARADLPARVLAGAAVVAATFDYLGDSLGVFDLVVLEDAQRLTDADLFAAARLADRAVLVGDAFDGPRPGPFARLWKILHAEPRSLYPSHRRCEYGQTVRLRPGRATREPLYDREHILIGLPDDDDPLPIEVSFPAETALADIQSFLRDELRTHAFRASSRNLTWEHTPTHVVAHLSEPREECRHLPAEPGVQATWTRCAQRGWLTASLAFSLADGWDAGRAADFIDAECGLRDTGRTALLCSVYRSRPGLVRLLSGLLFDNIARPGREVGTKLYPAAPPAEFVAVPPKPARGRAPSGAGLEVDLADARRIDAVPTDLRPMLPARGLVNYTEARAVISAVEAMLRDADARAALREITGDFINRPAVALVSCYPAQAELLRLLAARSEAVGASGLRVVSGLPGDFAHDEIPAVFVSLTRSHATRAVTFGDDSAELVLAVTRAVGRLAVFGDAGTLAKRLAWHKPLDHLGAEAAEAEHAVLSRLIDLPSEPEAATARGPRHRESAGV